MLRGERIVVRPDNMDVVHKFVDRMAAKYTTGLLTWQDAGVRPSQAQRGLMHAWFSDIATTFQQRSGKPFTLEYIKETMKFRYGPVDELTNKPISTERYTPAQRNDFLSRIEVYAIEQGVRLTAVPPDDTYNQYREAHN